MKKVRDIPGLCANVQYLVLPPLYNNCYIVSFLEDGEEQVLIVDAASKPECFIDAIGDRPVKGLILTHGHFDHFGAANALRKHYGCSVYASALDSDFIEGKKSGVFRQCEPCPVDIKLDNEQRLKFGDIEMQVIFTPGHSEGSMCLLVSSGKAGKRFLLSGDMLFKSSIGRTDLEYSDPHKMVDSIHKISKLDDDIVVLPGHNAFTTIKDERNFYLDKI